MTTTTVHVLCLQCSLVELITQGAHGERPVITLLFPLFFYLSATRRRTLEALGLTLANAAPTFATLVVPGIAGSCVREWPHSLYQHPHECHIAYARILTSTCGHHCPRTSSPTHTLHLLRIIAYTYHASLHTRLRAAVTWKLPVSALAFCLPPLLTSHPHLLPDIRCLHSLPLTSAGSSIVYGDPDAEPSVSTTRLAAAYCSTVTVYTESAAYALLLKSVPSTVYRGDPDAEPSVSTTRLAATYCSTVAVYTESAAYALLLESVPSTVYGRIGV
ncbi:hypothetical protein GGX14DRAFT_632637 [Mycena pura]|uniref:Uncharacterized protein n=1 Tax=Mycena pura TaxID=153505 RepID=A0AAD6YCQ1_9AGAR|nr:hypothetical protein GGX14DRAFT_632637 [Mycena pura]